MSARWFWPALLLLGCISLREPAPTRYWAGVGDCPPGLLTNACREREWSLLREDPRAAANHLRELCDDSKASPCFELGLLLGLWRNLPHDEARAREAFSSACVLFVPEACALEALMLEAGRGGPRQLDRAAALHQRACSLGWESSCEERRRLLDTAERPGEVAEPTCTEPCAGGLTQSELARVMRRRQGSARYCDVLAQERDHTLAAKLTVTFVVDAAGKPGAVEVTGTTDEPLSACVAEAVSDFQFPRPRAGAAVHVTHTYLFVTGAADAGS